jgi:hypothetical protein
MLYFRPRRDEQTVRAANLRGEQLEAAYRKYVTHLAQYHMFDVPLDMLTPDVRDESDRLLREYQQVRASLIGNLPVLKDLASRYKVTEPTSLLLEATDLVRLSGPSPIVLNYAEQQAWIDALNMLLGTVRFRRAKERRQILNPFWLLWLPIRFVLRLPLETLRVMGFSVEEFEKHFWGKFILLIFLAAVLWIALKGFNVSIEQLTNLISAIKK